MKGLWNDLLYFTTLHIAYDNLLTVLQANRLPFHVLYEKITNTEFIICIPRRWLNKLFIWVVVVLADINITVAILFIDLVLKIWFSCKNGNVYRPCSFTSCFHCFMLVLDRFCTCIPRIIWKTPVKQVNICNPV